MCHKAASSGCRNWCGRGDGAWIIKDFSGIVVGMEHHEMNIRVGKVAEVFLIHKKIVLLEGIPMDY